MASNHCIAFYFAMLKVEVMCAVRRRPVPANGPDGAFWTDGIIK
jgi:hypothetical protein